MRAWRRQDKNLQDWRETENQRGWFRQEARLLREQG